MNGIAWLILIGGMLHFGILLASAAVPQVLDFREQLRPLGRLLRQLIWVHGAFIVLVIVAFGLLSIIFATQLAGGSPLARGVCAFIAIFWILRLLVQFFVFDAKPYLKRWPLALGYHGLTLVFVYHAVAYSLAAVLPV